MVEILHRDGKVPEHQAVYEVLPDRIFLGRFASGQPMTRQGPAEGPILTRAALLLGWQVGPHLRVVSRRSGSAHLPNKHDTFVPVQWRYSSQNAKAAMRVDREQDIIPAAQHF